MSDGWEFATWPDRVVSYYSSRERDDSGKTITAIYLANLELGK